MMKYYTGMGFFILISLSLSPQAMAADAEDLEIFYKTNYCQGCDLSGVEINKDHDNGFLLNSYAIKTEFSGSLQKMNFSGSIMNYSVFTHFFHVQHIQEANFDKVNMSYSRIIDADLSGANLSDVNLSNSDLDNVNLSGVNFTNANLTNTTISYSILIGAQITQDQLEQVKSIDCTVMPDGELNTKGCSSNLRDNGLIRGYKMNQKK